jgi:hypothetical protein
VTGVQTCALPIYNKAINIIDKNKIELISAFIPPINEENYLSLEIEESINKIIRKRKIVACTNAHNYVVDKSGNDLYGIDFLLRIFSNLPDFCLLISDPSANLKKKYFNYVDCDNILFISVQHQFVEIIKKSNLLIRATTTDGDSLSIKEAFYYNVDVIASDCVDRPQGCNLYITLNEESFLKTLFKSKAEKHLKIYNGAKQIIEIYRNIIYNKYVEHKNF